jgi:hypothetical protein
MSRITVQEWLNTVLHFTIILILANAILVTVALDQECDTRTILVSKEGGREEPVALSSFPKKEWKALDGTEKYMHIVNPEKSIYYVPNFLDDRALVQELVSFCQDQRRFVPSPQRQTGGSTSTSNDDKRTSESCPMIPSGTYLKNPQYQDMATDYEAGLGDEAYRQRINLLMQEVNATWQITQHAASLPISDATIIDPYHVEPLQLVRYIGSGATYRTHHDHGSFYGNQESEQRPFTVLVYLNSVQGGGGATSFPKLGLRFLPIQGDAIVWSNIRQDDGTVDPDMVHAGEPPATEDGTKYALNIWIGQAALTKENAGQGQWS